MPVLSGHLISSTDSNIWVLQQNTLTVSITEANGSLLQVSMGENEERDLTVRVNLGELSNPYMTARMFVKFVQSSRAILIPKDFQGHTVLILDSKDSILLSEKVRKIKTDMKIEVLGQSFEEILRQTEKAISDKKAFLLP